MIRIVLLAFAVAQSPVLRGAEKAADLLLYARDPWHMVIGSESPLFALYSDGQAIFFDTESGMHKSVQLSKDERAQIMERCESLKGLPELSQLTNVTDQPTTELRYSSGGRMKRIFVYGRLRLVEKSDNQLLKPFKTLVEQLSTYDNPKAVVWKPHYVEVIVWPYEYAPEESIVWPMNWPDLKSKYSLKRQNGAYSIYMPYERKEELSRFLSAQKEKGAVLINGRKWAVSTRIPFPHENQPD